MQLRMLSTKRLFGFPTSTKELQDISRAWLAISIAFAIMLGRDHLFTRLFVLDIIFAAITVGLGFLLHELAHKIVALHYGCVAEFRAYSNMLLLMIVLAFFGFVFAAPGAVVIDGPVGIRRNGKISAAGPATNIVLAFLFLGLAKSTSSSLGISIGNYGFMINSWLALFNLIPIWNLDGRKVLNWSKPVYALMVIISLLLVFFDGLGASL